MSVVIHRISGGEAEQRSYYRLLHNAGLDTASIKDYLYADCGRQVVPAAHYLCIEDTTQPNFESKRKNISNMEWLGLIGDGKSLGFFLHPSLVVGAGDGRANHSGLRPGRRYRRVVQGSSGRKATPFGAQQF